LSPDAIDVIEKLLTRNPKKRMTALQMLEHPWVRGETARRDKIADSDKKLANYRVFKSRLEAQVFDDMISWPHGDDTTKQTSLMERSFRKLDPQRKGYLTTKDLKRLTQNDDKSDEGTMEVQVEEDATPLSLSGFSDLLSDHMNNKFFPKGHVIFREGEIGKTMYFLNSGTVEVSTKDGLRVKLGQGDFFGEGALLDSTNRRSGTIKCVTPVHVIEIDKTQTDKYLSVRES
jgi:serine/threonine protein kinase